MRIRIGMLGHFNSSLKLLFGLLTKTANWRTYFFQFSSNWLNKAKYVYRWMNVKRKNEKRKEKYSDDLFSSSSRSSQNTFIEDSWDLVLGSLDIRVLYSIQFIVNGGLLSSFSSYNQFCKFILDENHTHRYKHRKYLIVQVLYNEWIIF